MAIALGSHVPLDALNSYGVHPFYPVDSSWYFGDAVFIFEPGFWIVLGLAAAWNARTRTARLVSALPIVIFPIAMVSTDIVPIEAARRSRHRGWVLRLGGRQRCRVARGPGLH